MIEDSIRFSKVAAFCNQPPKLIAQRSLPHLAAFRKTLTAACKREAVWVC
jgi:hypothetical protein